MILVTGATGRIGGRLVSRLLAAGHGVRILTRPTSEVPVAWSGVDVVRGDLRDPASIRRAVAGAASVFLLSPMDPHLDRWEAEATGAAQRAGVTHLVKMSTTAPAADSPIPWWRAHWRAEAHVRASGVPWTILRPNGIATFLLDFAADVRAHRAIRTSAGGGRMALVHPDDVADAAARVLGDGGQTMAATTWDITGPTALSYDDVAEMLSTLLGRRVTHQPVTDAAAQALLNGRGLLDWEAEGIHANWVMTRDGVGAFDRVTRDVDRLLGRPPLSIIEFLAANIAAFAVMRPDPDDAPTMSRKA